MQGQHRYGGPHAHVGRVARAEGFDSLSRFMGRRPIARRWCRDLGKDESQRVGEHQIDTLVEWLERPRWPGEKSLCTRPQYIRLELRLGGSGRGELLCCGDRQ